MCHWLYSIFLFQKYIKLYFSFIVVWMRRSPLFRCLNTCSLVSGIVWMRLGSYSLPREVCHLGVGLEVSKPFQFALSFWSLRFSLWALSFCSSHHACLLPCFPAVMNSISGTVSPNKPFFRVAVDTVFPHSNRKWQPSQFLLSLLMDSHPIIWAFVGL